MMTINRGYIDLVLFSFCVGLVGVCVKATENLDAITIVFYRGAIAALFILVLTLVLGKGRTLVTRRAGAAMNLNVAGITAGIGLLQALLLIFYIGSLLQTSVTNAVFLHSTAPIFALIFSRIFLKETITPKTYMGIVLVMVGTCIIVDPQNLSFSSRQSIGNLMALTSGLFYGAMAVASKSLSPKVDGNYQVFWQYLIIAVLILPFAKLGITVSADSSLAAANNIIFPPSSVPLMESHFIHTLERNWLPLSLLGIVGSGLCYVFFVRGIKTVPAQHIMLAAALEPVFGSLIAAAYLGESLSNLTLAGAGLILFGILQVSHRGEPTPRAYNQIYQRATVLLRSAFGNAPANER